MSHALDELLNMAERAYLRMQAGQLIAQCLDEDDLSVFDELLQQLVLAGAPSLAALLEIREEVRSTSRSLRQAGTKVRKDLTEALAGFGLRPPQSLIAGTPESFRHICSPTLRNQVQQAARDLEAEERTLVDEICREAGERVSTIARQLALLRRLDGAVSDWLDCIAYEAARVGGLERNKGSGSRPH